MASLSERFRDPAPTNYTTPPFPSLYWPFLIKPGGASYLYYYRDIWRYTLLWTLIVYGAVYLTASAYAVIMQRKSWKIVWTIPLVFAIVGGIEAVLAGSLIGLILAVIYNTGFFKMSTWIPFVWAVINVLVLILSSFSIQGGL